MNSFLLALLLAAAPAAAQDFGAFMLQARDAVSDARFFQPWRLFGDDQPSLDAGSCPAPDALAQPWVEHAGPLPKAVLAAHLRAAPDAAVPILLPVNGVSWWIGASRRGRGTEDTLASPGCFVLGSAAFYANGTEEAPTVDFVRTVASGAEQGLRGQLVELRWYDAADGRKHRWFDLGLARRLGWDVDGRGAPTDARRPIPLPDALNELL